MVLALGLAALLVIAIPLRWNAWVAGGRWQRTDDAQLKGDLTPLSARVGGYVRRALAGDYLPVRRGQVLVEIEDDDYRAQVAQAQAEVEGAGAALDNNAAQQALQAAAIAAADALVAADRADLVRAELQARREHVMAATDAVAQQEVETADAARLRAAAVVRQVEAQALSARRQVEVLRTQARQLAATLAARRAGLSLAEINLGHTRITAPADGLSGERFARAGQLVSAGAQVVSVTPVNGAWVVANFKETQLLHMRVGQPARLTLDAFAGRRFEGRVAAISPASGSQFALLPPDNASGNYTKVVQRVPVRITLEDVSAEDAARLRPGLSVIAAVDTGSGR